MTKREMLHEIADRLSDEEVPLALRILEAIQEEDHPSYSLDDAPADDEPFAPSEVEGLDEQAILSHEDVKGRLAR